MKSWSVDSAFSIGRAAFFVLITAILLLAFFGTIEMLQRQELERENASLKKDLKDAKYFLKKKSSALNKCVKDLMGEKSGFIPLYESVETVDKMEFIIHSPDTESGEPRKFILDCGGSKP